MKKLAFITLALVASISFAATPAKKAPAKKAAVSKDLVKSNVTGTVNWTGYGVGKSHAGSIPVKSGYIETKGSDLVGGAVVLDMAALKTGDSPKLEGHLKSPDFFDVTKFSEGTFKITKVEALKNVKAGEATHKITGDLTIKGKTHSEEFMAVVNKNGASYTASAQTEIKDRTQYDIVYNSAKFKAASALGDKLIQDNIKIQLDVHTN